MQERICPICGGPVPRKNGKYCSRKCLGEALRGKERPAMKDQVPWNAGLTSETDDRIAEIARQKRKDVVDAATLHDLYNEQGLTLRGIGTRYGVSHAVIRRLVDEYGLKRKRETLSKGRVQRLYADGRTFEEIAQMFDCSTAYVIVRARAWGIKSRKHQNKAGVIADPEELRHLYWDEWLSYEAIAEVLSVDFTSIPYWLKKFGIPTRSVWETRRGPGFQPPDPETVMHLYQAECIGLDSIGQLFGVSKGYIKQMLQAVGIELRHSGYPNRPGYIAKDGHQVRSGLELQVDDWLFSHDLEHEYEPAIDGTKYKADFRVGSVMVEIWGIEGHAKYDQQRSKKTAAYERLGLALLSVYRKDFPHLDVLKTLLPEDVV